MILLRSLPSPLAPDSSRSRVPLPLGSLLSMSMRDGETLKAYSDRYWEMFNEIDGDYDDVAISTFKTGLPAEHDLRKSLTGKPVTSVDRKSVV